MWGICGRKAYYQCILSWEIKVWRSNGNDCIGSKKPVNTGFFEPWCPSRQRFGNRILLFTRKELSDFKWSQIALLTCIVRQRQRYLSKVQIDGTLVLNCSMLKLILHFYSYWRHKITSFTPEESFVWIYSLIKALLIIIFYRLLVAWQICITMIFLFSKYDIWVPSILYRVDGE